MRLGEQPGLEHGRAALQGRGHIDRPHHPILGGRWIEGMLAHNHHGAKQIEERITNLVGLAGTVGVPSSLFDRVFARFVEDEELFRRLGDNNIHATLAMVRRLGEAAQRELWLASAEQRDLLKQRYLGLEREAE